jgi:tripartite-type tricarboxylate transporter receptor subunit TctC
MKNTFHPAAPALAILLACGTTAVAQEFPSKPVRIIASQAGSSGDFVARTVAEALARNLGQQVIVDNRGGGVIAGELVAKSPADGYTLLLYGNTHWLLPLMRKQVPYDAYRDFAPISTAARGVNILVVHPSLPVKSVKDLIALARARPGQLNFSSAALGTMNHLAAELFKHSAGINIVRVAYRGSPAAMNGVMVGETQLMFSPAAPAMPVIRAGKVRALAVSTLARSAAYPDLPTMVEAGLPGFEAVSIHGVFAPARTPDAVVTRLNREIVSVLQQPGVRRRLDGIGVEAAGGTPGEFATLIRDEVARLGKVIHEAKIEEQ